MIILVFWVSDAGAVYKINKISLVNVKVFEEYLETFRVENWSHVYEWKKKVTGYKVSIGTNSFLTSTLIICSMVSNDTYKRRRRHKLADMRTRIESELEVNTYLQNLRYALEHNATMFPYRK